MISSPLVEENDEVPSFSKLPFMKKLPYMKDLLKNSLPTLAAFLTPVFTTLVSLYFLANYNDDKLVAGYGLGSMFSNTFGSSWVYSFNQAMNVFISQAFGAQDYDACGRYLRRNIIILGFLFIPLGICLITADKLMILFGVEEELATLGGIFTKLSLPFMIGAGLFDSMKSFIIGQKVFQPIFYIQVITFCLHVLWSKLFIDYFRLGIEGTIICRTLEEWANTIMIYFYIKFSGKFEKTWGAWTKDLFNFKEMWKQFKFTTSISLISYIQWIVYEVLTIIAGNFDAGQVVVHIAIANTSSIFFNSTMALSVTLLTFVGNNLGARKLNNAIHYSHAGYTLLFIVPFLFGSMIWIFLDQWLNFWSSDIETHEILLQGLKVYVFGCMAVDGINNGMISILKSVGKEKQTILSILGSYYLIGVPLIMLFAFVFHLKVVGIWLAFGIANYFLCIYNVISINKLDWIKVQRDVLEKLQSQEDIKEQELQQLI